MKIRNKRNTFASLKMAAAFIGILGIVTFALSDTISTTSESTEDSLLSASTGGENEALLPESLRIVEEADYEGEVPLQIKFDSKQFVGPMENYDWNFGDGEMGQGAVASHTYTSAGIYQVTLTTTEESGMTHKKKILVSVEPKE